MLCFFFLIFLFFFRCFAHHFKYNHYAVNRHQKERELYLFCLHFVLQPFSHVAVYLVAHFFLFHALLLLHWRSRHRCLVRWRKARYAESWSYTSAVGPLWSGVATSEAYLIPPREWFWRKPAVAGKTKKMVYLCTDTCVSGGSEHDFFSLFRFFFLSHFHSVFWNSSASKRYLPTYVHVLKRRRTDFSWFFFFFFFRF